MNVFRYLLYCLVYLIIQYLAFLNLWVSVLADINTGIITGIWSLVPLFMAILDFIYFGERPKTPHVIGLICLLGCALCISFSKGPVDAG
mmetsp:Transcript_13330/g.22651  ORF Transcript_13330/g.22651 Transcript_13330/m.22651 type:complete len:89 (+) Transcript_13330:299-565(+)